MMQVDSYQVDGGAALSGSHTTVAYTYTYARVRLTPSQHRAEGL